MEFTLSGPQIRQDLLDEFALHHDVVTVPDAADPCVLRVETSDVPLAMWDVRATVVMFDDGASERRVER